MRVLDVLKTSTDASLFFCQMREIVNLFFSTMGVWEPLCLSMGKGV